MIDIKFLRDNPDAVRLSQQARGEDESLVDQVLAADTSRLETLQAFESARAEQNRASREVGPLMGQLNKAKKAGEDTTELQAKADAARAKGSELAAKVKELEADADQAQGKLNSLMMQIGNVIIDGVPHGGVDDFKVLEHRGPEPRDFEAEGFEPKDHVDLGEHLDAIDTQRGVKVSGARFYYLTGQGARLEHALHNYALDMAYEWGFKQLQVPTLVNPRTMGGAGFLDSHEEEVYRLKHDDLYLVGTSEVSLAGYHTDEVIDLSDGPKLYTALSTCYRREAGSYGKDTRGILRVHQFEKVEMFAYCRPEDAEQVHEKLLGCEKAMLDAMEIPYRIIDIAAGDLGGPAARKYDCEAWVPTQNKYRELTSTSNCTTFQARRLNVREKTDKGNRIVATLNGTLATTRWIVAVMENHQQADGTIRIPKALQKYMGTDVMTPGAR